jgi:uncharacterized protein YkwD
MPTRLRSHCPPPSFSPPPPHHGASAAPAAVAALAWSSSLANTARSWATYLADNDVTGSAIHHSTIWTNGENIYWISGGSGSALADRANLLRPTFHSVGVGIAQSSTGGWYVVQDFSN